MQETQAWRRGWSYVGRGGPSNYAGTLRCTMHGSITDLEAVPTDSIVDNSGRAWNPSRSARIETAQNAGVGLLGRIPRSDVHILADRCTVLCPTLSFVVII